MPNCQRYSFGFLHLPPPPHPLLISTVLELQILIIICTFSKFIILVSFQTEGPVDFENASGLNPLIDFGRKS